MGIEHVPRLHVELNVFKRMYLQQCGDTLFENSSVERTVDVDLGARYMILYVFSKRFIRFPNKTPQNPLGFAAAHLFDGSLKSLYRPPEKCLFAGVPLLSDKFQDRLAFVSTGNICA